MTEQPASNGTLGTMSRAVGENEGVTLTSFISALEAGAALAVTRIDWLTETDLIYIAAIIPILAWVMFRVFVKWVRPVLE